ncbi:MAG: cold-shock protein [Lautropia sp.]
MTTQIGIVKWFNTSKGFGFIMPETGGKDLFAHINDVDPSIGPLAENQRVQFEVIQGKKGPQASRIRAAA